uniref:Ig-like domain-containing protein n=1 Tax=Macrostomum lignano TaxID=282301 RepID=A0A1I8FUA6_9PLAT
TPGARGSAVVQYKTVLTVLKRVGAPQIAKLSSDYRAGSRLELACTALPGIPSGQLLWKRKRRDELDWSIVSATHQLLDGKLTNIVGLTVEPRDHLAEFQCEASNVAMETPETVAVQVNVNFPPAALFIYRDDQLVSNANQIYIRDGETALFQCRSGPHYDNLLVAWYIDQAKVWQNVALPDRTSGRLLEQYTLSNYTFVYSARQNRQPTIRCRVTNHFGYRQEISLRLQEHVPPRALILTAPNRIMANKFAEFICTCEGATPPPEISWHLVPPVKLEPITLKNLPVNPESATTSAAEFAENDELRAVCQGTGSNPKMTFTWQLSYCLRDDGLSCMRSDTELEQLKPDQSGLKHWPSVEHKGFDGQSLVQFRLTARHNLAQLICKASNPQYPAIVLKSMATLRVRHRPVIYGLGREMSIMQNSLEGRSVTIRANPRLTPGSVCVYRHLATTIGVGSDRKVSDKVRYADGTLFFENLTTKDAGRYSLEASNQLGLGSHNFDVTVRTPLRIARLAVQGESAHLDERTYFINNRHSSVWSAKIEAKIIGSSIVLTSSGSSAQWKIPVRRRQFRSGREVFETVSTLRLGCHEHLDGYTVACWGADADGTELVR